MLNTKKSSHKLRWIATCLIPVITGLSPQAARGDTFLFGGIDAGVAGLSTSVPNEVDKFGLDVDVKALLSFEIPSWVFDVGIGWRYDYIRGGSSPTTVSIDTRNGFVEFSPRYEIDSGWQLGPYAALHFGSQVGMGEVLASSQTTALYLGPQINYEWGSDDWRYRIGARAGFDMNVPDRTHWTAQVLLQIGMRLFGGAEPAAQEEKTAVEEPKAELAPAFIHTPPEPEPEVKTIAPDELGPRVRLYEDSAFRVESAGRSTLIITTFTTTLNFVTAKASLTPSAQKKFGRLAQYLNKNRWNWRQASVKGHADERGPSSYNVGLSSRRAAWIRRLLTANGVPATRIDSLGYGEDRPADPRHNQQAWAKNRRVEVVLVGVKEQAPLVELIRSIRK